MLLEELPRMGLADVPPVDGAFYVYGDVARLTNNSSRSAGGCWTEAGVATTPGLDFDRERGNRYVRLSFAGSPQSVREGVERLGAWLKRGI